MPVIEEIVDDEIDVRDSNAEDFDTHNPFSRDMPVDSSGPVQLRPTAGTSSASASRPRSSQRSDSEPPSLVDTEDDSSAPRGHRTRPDTARELPEHMKSWAVIYPLYFDKAESVKGGRRVPKELAVDNPLAVIIADACRSLGYEPALELTKRHPKDWANPGRVRIDLPEGKSKRSVYADISAYMKAHPASSSTARVDMYRQIAQFDSLTPLAKPRNMRLGKVLPGVSPALSSQKMIDDSMNMDGGQMARMMGMGG